jgi:hypothetical protein
MKNTEEIEYWKRRFLGAIQSQDPEGHLVREVIRLKSHGGTQQNAVEFLGAIWDEHYPPDKSNREMQIILENACDAITGQCAGSNHLFANDFKEEHFFRPIPPAIEPDELTSGSSHASGEKSP